MSFDVRPCGDLSEFDGALLSIGQYFGNEPDAEGAERFTRMLPIERMHAAWEDGQIVGGAGAFPFEMSVPGGRVALRRHDGRRRRADASPARRASRDDARASRRRARARRADRGALGVRGDDLRPLRLRPRRLSRARSRSRGSTSTSSRRASATGTDPHRRARRGAREVPAALGGARARRGRACSSARATGGSSARSRDPPERRGGAGPKRFALLERDGEAGGVRDLPPQDGLGGRRVERRGRRSSRRSRGDPAALAEIWRFLLDIDWIATITSSLLPPDHPLFFVLAQPRRMRYRSGDGLWVRLLDVGAALSGRTYPEDGELVFDVRDDVLPVERRAVAPRRRRRRAHGRRRRSRARRGGARRRVPRRHPLRAARAGRPRRGAEAGRDRARGRHVPPRPASVVPGDLLSAWAKLSPRPGRLAQLGEHQLDKLGVTGSSPVPPTHESPAQAGFLFSIEETKTRRNGPRVSNMSATSAELADGHRFH